MARTLIYTPVIQLYINHKLASEPEKKQRDNTTKNKRRTTANNVVDTNSMLGRLADLFPVDWGGERAGRASQLAQAAGHDPQFAIKYPVTAHFPKTLKYTAMGTAVGALTGVGLRSLGVGAVDRGGHTAPGLDLADKLKAATTGGIVGGVAGMTYSTIPNYLARRQGLQDAKDAYVNDGGTPVKPNLTNTGAVMGFYGGSHRKGQVDAYKYLSAPEESNTPVRTQPLWTDASNAFAWTNPLARIGAVNPVSSLAIAPAVYAARGLDAKRRLEQED